MSQNTFESIFYLGPKVWELVPDNLKSITSVSSLKEQNKIMEPIKLPI